MDQVEVVVNIIACCEVCDELTLEKDPRVDPEQLDVVLDWLETAGFICVENDYIILL